MPYLLKQLLTSIFLKVVLKNFSKFTSSLFIKIEAPAMSFSCEFCEIYKKTLSIGHIQVTVPIFNPNTKKKHSRKTSHLNIYYQRLRVTKSTK